MSTVPYGSYCGLVSQVVDLMLPGKCQAIEELLVWISPL